MNSTSIPVVLDEEPFIEVANLCAEHGCHDCPGVENKKDEVVVFCIHGCHGGSLQAKLS